MVRWVWDQIESWLVGCLLYLPRSYSTEKRELKGAYILLKPSENVQQACDIGLTGRVGIYVHGKQNRTKSSKRSGMVPCIRS